MDSVIKQEVLYACKLRRQGKTGPCCMKWEQDAKRRAMTSKGVFQGKVKNECQQQPFLLVAPPIRKTSSHSRMVDDLLPLLRPLPFRS